MNETAIEARGIEPLKPYLDAIAAVKTKPELMKLIGNIDYAAPLACSPRPTRSIPNATPSGSIRADWACPTATII